MSYGPGDDRYESDRLHGDYYEPPMRLGPSVNSTTIDDPRYDDDDRYTAEDLQEMDFYDELELRAETETAEPDPIATFLATARP